ncbi:hypothetical protein TNCV_3235391 [Trichonephila clavipes]|nr:hypothetical protein TNCV_3235391 [Trichonephila clavipes]
MRVLYRSRQDDRLHVMLVLVHIDITPPHTTLPVFRRIGERTIPCSWRASSSCITWWVASFGFIRIESVQWCTTAHHYATTHRDSFATQSGDFCYVGGKKASSIFSPCENSTRISLSGSFNLITKKNKPAFLWCPRLMFSAPQYPVVPIKCSQRDAPDWTQGVQTSL